MQIFTRVASDREAVLVEHQALVAELIEGAAGSSTGRFHPELDPPRPR